MCWTGFADSGAGNLNTQLGIADRQVINRNGVYVTPDFYVGLGISPNLMN